MLKKLFYIGIFSLLSFSASAGLKEQLQLKTENYTSLQKYYEALLASISHQDTKEFCSINDDAFPLLSKILEDDYNLINELRSVQNQDYYDYATHLEENSASPLFSFYGYQDTCQGSDQSILLQMSQSMKYHVMNIEYLKLNHEMWVKGFETTK